MNKETDNPIYYAHEYNIDVANREVFLHSYFDGEDEPGLDYRAAITFEKNIRYLNTLSSDPIIVHMHLPGGDWTDCLGVYDTISLSKAPICIIAYAKAESASGIIFQSAKLRILMPNSYVLIHYGFLTLDGEHKAAISNLQWTEKEAKKMIDFFTTRCEQSPLAKEREWKKSSVRKYISSQLSQKSDWILSAEDAVYHGFADGIYGSTQYSSIENIRKKLTKL
jgi:ATP-dependent protease ClpP protease subunit